MRKGISILLAIVMLLQICVYVPAPSAKAKNLSTEEKKLLEFFQSNYPRLIVTRGNYGYMNFVAEFNSSAGSLYLIEMCDKLIQTGSKPSKEKYIEILLNIIATYDMDNAAEIGKQKERDNLKKAEDYAMDVLDIGKEAVSVISGTNLSESGLESAILLAIDGLGVFVDNTENYIKGLSNLETLTQNYSQYDDFLRLIENKAEGDLKEAAQTLREGMEKTFRIRLNTYENMTNESFKNCTEFFFNNFFFELVKDIPEYEDETVKFVVDGGEKFLSALNLAKSSWDLGKSIGKLVGNLTVGGEDLINRTLEMMAIYDISVILQEEAISLQTTFLNNLEDGDNQDVIDSYISVINYLIGCRIRGEYCLYSVVANDAKLLSWFNQKKGEETKIWYETVSSNLVYIRDEIRKIQQDGFEVSDYFENWKGLVTDYGMQEKESEHFTYDYFEKNGFELGTMFIGENGQPDDYTMINNGCEDIYLYGIEIGDDGKVAQEILLRNEWWFDGGFYKLINEDLFYIYFECDDSNKVKYWSVMNWPEGEFISDIRKRVENNQEEIEKQASVLKNTKYQLLRWYYDDFDGDSTKEGYGITGEVVWEGEIFKYVIKEVISIDANGSAKIMKDEFWGKYLGDGNFQLVEYADRKFLAVDTDNGDSEFHTYVFGYKDKKPYELQVSNKIYGLYTEDGRVYTTKEAEQALQSRTKVPLEYNTEINEFVVQETEQEKVPDGEKVDINAYNIFDNDTYVIFFTCDGYQVFANRYGGLAKKTTEICIIEKDMDSGDVYLCSPLGWQSSGGGVLLKREENLEYYPENEDTFVIYIDGKEKRFRIKSYDSEKGIIACKGEDYNMNLIPMMHVGWGNHRKITTSNGSAIAFD